MEDVAQKQLEEDLLLLIFKFGFSNVETTLEVMKKTIRGRFEERMKIILPLTVPVQESVPEPEPEEQVPEEPAPEEPIPKGTNEKKKAQREAEKRKKEENEANGIFAQDLLTEENLRTWKTANHSNAYIAREFVGCREEEVAKAMKKFGIFKPLSLS
jgi:hypothetical protein